MAHDTADGHGRGLYDSFQIKGIGQTLRRPEVRPILYFATDTGRALLL